MTQLDLLVVSNAITDKVYHVSAAVLQGLDLRRGAEHRAALRSQIEEKLKDIPKAYESPAGSPANVGFSAAVLGARVGLIGSLGGDHLGTKYREMLGRYAVADHTQLSTTYPSGVCYTLITEDGERTFLNLMNAAPHFDLDQAPISAKIIHTSCYEIVDKEKEFIGYLQRAKKAGAKISLDLADPHTCHKIGNGQTMRAILDLTDILFASPEEYAAAVGKEFDSFSEHPCNNQVVCLKLGKRGSRVLAEGIDLPIPIVSTTVINTNGAGDGYAAGFLFAYLQNTDLAMCGMYGSSVASQIVGQVAASLPLNQEVRI
ncbi:adenosine kinase [Candidatus Woesearchaeota archaeon]|nr:adenosine kinase [Candidatus Woesearchaeota archaeon]